MKALYIELTRKINPSKLQKNLELRKSWFIYICMDLKIYGQILL